MEWKKGEFLVSCDPDKADLEVIAGFLSNTYWAKNIPAATVRKSLQNSLVFSLLKGKEQIGFARVISDFATIGYLGDVFVLPDYREQGLAKWMLECVFAHPELQGFRRWILATLDAHPLYEKFGFTPLGRPEVFMEKFNPAVYANEAS
ncbi:MAG TPA: GNAT family N-acetyltransferase [Terriglobales bacterium]|jgi:GNAT superfamily N-acetyltransferase|nr:GNAT family N-acetyltransferase [Terriglobales bacterium]